jgi:CheY-like chemotaxis protein
MRHSKMRRDEPARDARKLVLVVEDDRDVRECIAEALGEEGYDVVCAENGSEAFEVLSRVSRPPDVVLLDLMLPVMNGWEMIDAFNEDSQLAEIPVIVVTAHSNAHVPEAEGFLPKPFERSQLLDLVREHCS